MGNSQSRARSHYLDIAREALEATQHLREEVGVRGPAWRGRRTRRDDAIVLYLEGRYDDKDLVINVSAIAMNEFMRLAGTAVLRDWQDQHPQLIRCDLEDRWNCPLPRSSWHHYFCGKFPQLPAGIWIDPNSDYPGLHPYTGDSNDGESSRRPSRGVPLNGRYAGNGAYTSRTSRPSTRNSHETSGAVETPQRPTTSRRASTGSDLGHVGDNAFTGTREANRNSHRAAPAGPDRNRRNDRTTTADDRDTDQNLGLVSTARPSGELSGDRHGARGGTQSGSNRTGYQEPNGARGGARPGGEINIVRQTATTTTRVDRTWINYREPTGAPEGGRPRYASGS